MNKKILFLLCLIFFIISIGAVSAEDDLNQTVPDDTLAISQESELNADAGTFSDLQSKINNAPASSTISLENDYTYNSGFSTDGIDIDKDITINGNGHYINGLGKSAIFSMRDVSVTLNNINFINGYAEGEAAPIFCGGYLNVNNCNFNNNEGELYGALLATHVDIINCNFNNNLGDGAISFAGSVYEDSYTSTVSGCSFNNNEGLQGGALNLFNYEKISYKITNCKFKSNSAYMGGAIYDGGNCEIRDCEFTDNKADIGGAIFCNEYDNFNVYGSKFINNYAKESGGAVNTVKLISNCYFENNEANYDEDTGGEGGAVLVADKVINSKFIKNRASNGGAIRNVNEIANCEFTENEAYCGGAIDSSKKVTNSIFTNNIGKEGGSIYYYLFGDEECTVTITDNEFKSNGNYDFIYLGSGSFGDSNVINLNNNKMTANNNYDIYLDGCGKINFDVNLVFLNTTAAPESNIILCELQDNLGNTIVTPGSVNAKLTNNDDKSVKNILVESDDEVYTFKYDCTYEDEPLPEGVYALTGSLNSDLIKNYKTKNGVLIIDGDTNYTLAVQNLTKYYGGPERLTATVINGKGRFIPGLTVDFNINGQTYSRVTNSNGQASIGINLNSGKYDATVEFNGIKAYSTVTIKPTIVSNDFTKIFRNDTQYYGKFLDSHGNLLKNTQVRFNINGVFYDRTTNNQGIAHLNINLNPGTYVLTATNPTNGEMQSVTITVLSSIVENYDLTKYYKNDSQYRIRLLDAQGNPVGAGVSVQFNINGVFYTRTSDANGYVKMNINLNPGTYVITANYNGLMASNTIKVLPILKANDLNMSYRDGSKFEATLLDGQGKAYANQNITFNINGVFYTRTTDANGIARLNINLMAGKYIITSMYENGAAISNKVTIRS